MPISAESSRILIIQPGRPADVCRCVPLAASLRRARPKARIDWLVRPESAPLLAAHPEVDDLIILPHESPSGWRRGFRAAAKVRELLRALPESRYDLVIDAHGREGSGRFARAARAPIRIGPADASLVDRMGYTMLASMPGSDDAMHLVDRTFAMLEPIGIEPVVDMRIVVRKEDAAWWRDRGRELGTDIAEGAYAVLAPASSKPGKRWPIERWAELIRPLLYRGFERAVLIGSDEDREQVRLLIELAEETNADGDGPLIDLVGETDIGRMMAVIGGAGLVVSNDTLPLNVAAGLDRLCVGLFGPTDPKVTGPYGRPGAALRAFVPKPGELISPTDPKLGDTLMRVISTAAVIQKIDQVLDEAADVQAPVDEANPVAVNEGGRT